MFRVSVPALGGRFESDLDRSPTHETLTERYGSNAASVKFLLVTWTSLLSDSPLGASKDMHTIHKFFTRGQADVYALVATYADLAHELTKSLTRTNDGMTATYLKSMEKTPVYREYLHFFRTRDPLVLKYLLTFLSFGKKTYFKNPMFNADALRKWRGIEERLGSIQLSVPVLKNLRVIVDRLFTDWDFDQWLPMFSNGAVAERKVRGVMAKSANMRLSPMIEYLYLRGDNIMGPPNETGSTGYPTYVSSLRESLGDQYPAEGQEVYTTIPTKSRKASRLKFVPKNYKSVRSICMEPNVVMWAQQGVRLVYEAHLKRNKWLKNHVDLERQEVNQEGARWGSETGLVDTIDLSSASDSVMWKLIQAVFKPAVLKHLHATRTSLVELPDGTWMKVHKFAPMGSALCFPVQCTLYTAICIMIGISWAYCRNWRLPDCFDGLDLDEAYKNSFFFKAGTRETRRLQNPLIYGDDIILDKRVTSSVVECLQMLGFDVNVEKSYFGDEAYRESCGKHFALGYDVTPMMLKIGAVFEDGVEPKVLAGIIDQANHAFQYGYLNLRAHLIQFCLRYPIRGFNDGRRPFGRNPILFTTDKDATFALHCDNPRNTHLRSRNFDLDSVSTPDKIRKSDTHIAYQRSEWASVTLKPCKIVKHDSTVDGFKYIAWWRSKYGHTTENDDFSSGMPTADALSTRASWRWTPIEA